MEFVPENQTIVAEKGQIYNAIHTVAREKESNLDPYLFIPVIMYVYYMVYRQSIFLLFPSVQHRSNYGPLWTLLHWCSSKVTGF